MNQLFIINGRVEGAQKISKMIGFAPEKFRETVKKWLYRERDSFVGNNDPKRRKDGAFRKKLQRKISNRGIPWEQRVTRVFRGRLEGEKSLDTMKLIMGAGTRDWRDSDFVKGLRVLGSGGSISSSNFMIVPIYKNFRGTRAEPHNKFKGMLSRDALVYIRVGGQVLYVDKQMIEQGSDIYGATMFIGTHRIKVPKQFDFEGDWNARIPSVMSRGQKMIDKTTQRIEKTYG